MPVERKLVLTKSFEKSLKRFAGKNQSLQNSIRQTLQKLQNDCFDSALRTHKLSGKLAAGLSCSCGYDCRIIFTIEKQIDDPGKENIVLHDVGARDEFIEEIGLQHRNPLNHRFSSCHYAHKIKTTV
jgi:mRNA interferase YafQ